MRLIKTATWIVFLLLLVQIPAFASVLAGVEWRYQDGEQSMDNLTLNWETTKRWNTQVSYGIDDEDLALDVFYKTNTKGKIQPYLGVGVRDLLQKSEVDRTVPEKIEVAGGISVNLSQRISMTLDLKVVPNNLFNDEDDSLMDPRLSIGLNYRLPDRLSQRNRGTMNADDFELLARLVMAEAGNEPYEGQVAVAAVILNRTHSSRYSSSVREVIYQKGQFKSASKLSYTVPTETSRKAVAEALKGDDPSHGALYFYNPRTSSAEGLAFFNSGKLRVTAKIGNHLFLIDR